MFFISCFFFFKNCYSTRTLSVFISICPLTVCWLPDETESSWIIRYVPAWPVSHACVNGGKIHLFNIHLKYFIMTPDLFRLFVSFSQLPAVKLKPDQSTHTVILIVWSSWTEYQLLKLLHHCCSATKLPPFWHCYIMFSGTFVFYCLLVLSPNESDTAAWSVTSRFYAGRCIYRFCATASSIGSEKSPICKIHHLFYNTKPLF